MLSLFVAVQIPTCFILVSLFSSPLPLSGSLTVAAVPCSGGWSNQLSISTWAVGTRQQTDSQFTLFRFVWSLSLWLC